MALWKRLAAGLVTGAMLLTSAGAVDAVNATVNSTGEFREVSGQPGVYQVDFKSNLLRDGYQYVLLVASYNNASAITSGGQVSVTIDESSLTFIDQAAATGDTVSFSVRPKNIPNSLVLLGGEFNNATSPIVIGYINGKGELKEFTLQAADRPSTSRPLDLSGFTFTVYNGALEVADIKNATAAGSAPASAEGKVSIQIPEGPVTIQITRPGYVPMTIINYDVSKDISEYLNNLAQCAGNTNGDNTINSFDIVTIIPRLGTLVSNSADVVDVNRDGKINSFDISALIPNMGITGRTYRCQ